MNHSAASLREILFDAFANTSAPAAEEITDACWELDLERNAIRAAFAGRLWHELPDSLFSEHRQALFLLTVRAWAYYVPGYMLGAMDARGEAGREFPDDLDEDDQADVVEAIRVELNG
jgi:hypothetical protein